MANISKSVKLGVFTLAIMNVTAVVSLRGGAGFQHLPVLCRYGNGRYPRKRHRKSCQELSESCIHRCGYYRNHLRARHLRTGDHYSRKGYQPDSEPAGRF